MEHSTTYAKQDAPFIKNGAVTLFKKQGVLDDAVEAVRTAGYDVRHIDCGTEARMAQDLGNALNWQEQFGYFPDRLNLDALNDALRGLPNAQTPKLLLVFDPFTGFWNRSQKQARGVLDIIEYQSRDHLLEGHRLLAFVKSGDPNLHIDGLGGRLAQWNPKEWLMKSRGV